MSSFALGVLAAGIRVLLCPQRASTTEVLQDQWTRPSPDAPVAAG